MSKELLGFVISVGETFMKSIPISLALAAVFTVLAYFWSCNPGKPWWQKRDIVTDLCYWFFIPVAARYFRIGLLVAGAAVLFGITTADGLIAFYENGHGPLAALPLVAQMILFLVGEDLHHLLDPPFVSWGKPLEISCRAPFLRRTGMDLCGAFSPGEHLFWFGDRRRALLLAGISPDVFVVLGPVTIAHRLRARHSSLDARTVQDTCLPARLHRWHHTAAERGGEKNFAATFPILDILFGTFYMPAGQLPDQYGVDDKAFPTTFGGQLAHPFMAERPGSLRRRHFGRCLRSLLAARPAV